MWDGLRAPISDDVTITTLTLSLNVNVWLVFKHLQIKIIWLNKTILESNVLLLPPFNITIIWDGHGSDAYHCFSRWRNYYEYHLSLWLTKVRRIRKNNKNKYKLIIPAFRDSL